jgi:hypothetical protein
VKEISVILKNEILIPVDEFRALARYSYSGQVWSLIHRPNNLFQNKITHKAVEYIFDEEALTIFCIVSNNILATWDTKITVNFGPNDELQLKDSLFIRPYTKTR